MHVRRILDHRQRHVIERHFETHALAGLGGILEQPALECRVGPRFRHHPRTAFRGAAFDVLDQGVNIIGAEQAFLDQQFAHGYFQLAEVGQRVIVVCLRRVAMAGRVVMPMIVMVV